MFISLEDVGSVNPALHDSVILFSIFYGFLMSMNEDGEKL